MSHFPAKTAIGNWPHACPLCRTDPKPIVKTTKDGVPYVWCQTPGCQIQIPGWGSPDRARNIVAQMVPMPEHAEAHRAACLALKITPPASDGKSAAGDAKGETSPPTAQNNAPASPAARKSGGGFTLLNSLVK